MIIMIRLTLQITDQLRKIRMSDVRHDHTDRVRRLFGKRTRHLIRAVIELLHRLIYFFLVSSLIYPRLFSTREIVLTVSPVSFATSFKVAILPPRKPVSSLYCPFPCKFFCSFRQFKYTCDCTTICSHFKNHIIKKQRKITDSDTCCKCFFTDF